MVESRRTIRIQASHGGARGATIDGLRHRNLKQGAYSGLAEEAAEHGGGSLPTAAEAAKREAAAAAAAEEEERRKKKSSEVMVHFLNMTPEGVEDGDGPEDMLISIPVHKLFDLDYVKAQVSTNFGFDRKCEIKTALTPAGFILDDIGYHDLLRLPLGVVLDSDHLFHVIKGWEDGSDERYRTKAVRCAEHALYGLQHEKPARREDAANAVFEFVHQPANVSCLSQEVVMLMITLFKDASQDGTPVLNVQKAVVRALWKLSEYPDQRKRLIKAGFVRAMMHVLNSQLCRAPKKQRQHIQSKSPPRHLRKSQQGGKRNKTRLNQTIHQPPPLKKFESKLILETDVEDEVAQDQGGEATVLKRLVVCCLVDFLRSRSVKEMMVTNTPLLGRIASDADRWRSPPQCSFDVPASEQLTPRNPRPRPRPRPQPSPSPRQPYPPSTASPPRLARRASPTSCASTRRHVSISCARAGCGCWSSC